jgi:FkbM family methyltransferase
MSRLRAARRSLRRTVASALQVAFRWPRLEHVAGLLVRGRDYSGLCRLIPLHTQYPAGSMRQAERYDCRFELDLSDLMQWYLFWGFRDPSHEALISLCKPGSTVVDVGANIGITALRCAHLSGESGKVVAIEPDPLNVARLRANIARNPAPNIEVLEVALGDREGTVGLGVPNARNRGGTRVETSLSLTTAEVQTTTLDHIAETHLDLRPNLLKIDVEGYETKVLRGGLRFISAFRPVIFLEVSDEHLHYQGSSPAELLSLLEGQGYSSVEAISRDAVHSTDLLAGRHFDVIAMPGAAVRQ